MKKLIPIAGVAFLILLFAAAYTVREGEQVIVTQFGKPVGEPVTEAGLHFKMPFLQDVRTFEKRILEWDGDPNQMPTLDKKFIEIDTTARWRISEPLTFLQTVQDQNRAQARLDDILNAETRDAISSHNLIEAVRSTSREMEVDIDAIEIPIAEGPGGGDARAGQESITRGRTGLVDLIFATSASQVEKFGIELIDFRIKQINYVEDVRRKVYDRMISERNKIAEKYRSEGSGQRAEINGEMQKELLTIRSDAYRREQQIIGEAEAEAAGLYAETYGRDPEFFAFVETLSAYLDIMDPNTTLVLSMDSQLLRYLKSAE